MTKSSSGHFKQSAGRIGYHLYWLLPSAQEYFNPNESAKNVRIYTISYIKYCNLVCAYPLNPLIVRFPMHLLISAYAWNLHEETLEN